MNTGSSSSCVVKSVLGEEFLKLENVTSSSVIAGDGIVAEMTTGWGEEGSYSEKDGSSEREWIKAAFFFMS